MIKAVFLDVGGTLLKPFPSVGTIYANVAAKHGVSVDAGVLDTRFKAAWKVKRDTLKPVEKKWWHEVVSSVFEDQHFANFETFFEDVYLAFEAPSAWHVFDDVRPTLGELQKRSVRMAVLSNWDERLPALLKALDLEKYFEHQFISFSMGIAKPNPQFFKYALNVMELQPSEAIHIGDDAEEDINGAQSAGLRAYHLNRDARPLSSRMMKSLAEIFVRI